MTSADILNRLRERYPLGDGWISLAECTPPKCDRRFDLLAVTGWASRGHVAMGFEIKVARSDWLKELGSPAKADPLVRLCTHWWIAAPPGVVKVAELPPAWGLLEFHPEQIRAAKQAPTLEPAPWDAATWRCLLLRCATRERHSVDELAAAKHQGWQDGWQRGLDNNRGEAERSQRQIDQLQETILRAQQATGVSLNAWTDWKALGMAMSLCRDSTAAGRLVEMLDRDIEVLRHAAGHMELAARALQASAQSGAKG